MKILFRHFILVLCFSGFIKAAEAQQYFVIEKFSNLKNFKYQVNNDITVQTRAGGFTLTGKITLITDSSIVIDHFTEVKIRNIQAVVKTRKFIKKLSGLYFIRGGLVYLGIVGINSAINHEQPVIDKQTAIISGAMIATGFALKPFIRRKMDVDKGWHIKILDFNNFEYPGVF